MKEKLIEKLKKVSTGLGRLGQIAEQNTINEAIQALISLKSESAEEVLSKYPSTKLGLDDFYGKKTTIQAMHDFANNSEAKWISVEDRLPENDNEVLIICSGEVVQAYLKNGIWKGSVQVTYNMNDGYVHDRNICKQGKSNPFDNVTHWMPLPTPPNQ